ncbi:YceI family protein [Spirosoma sp. RP8]|uniref:YceI family protein n=1 Tax=Spirosoma liriopis TaxID=2937440 RepID=A0ABT0HR71_9BACT|nr:YceI family protein [Spirosoma liriopis]MCK8494622.1 YceI family protein [Spirosoma liriopis]
MSTTKWVLDPTHSELGFKIKHLMISNISGSFQQFQVAVETDNDNFSTAQIRATAEIASIHTNNEQRDHHLRNSDFFDAETYPQLTFSSTKVEQLTDDTFNVYGNLTMKGTSKPVKLTVEYSGVTKDPWGGQRAGFTVTSKINRSDWGINFNGVLETGGLALGEEVKVNSEIQLVKQLATVTA